MLLAALDHWSQAHSKSSDVAKANVFPIVVYVLLIVFDRQDSRNHYSGKCRRCGSRVRLSYWRRSILDRGIYNFSKSFMYTHFQVLQEMSHTFSIKTMWRSVFCALVATFTLSVCFTVPILFEPSQSESCRL